MNIKLNYQNLLQKSALNENLLIDIFLKKGGSINIKKENKGKFTDYCKGKVTQDCIDKAKNSKNKTLRKRAIFAENARKWKHLNGGIFKTPEEIFQNKFFHPEISKHQIGGSIFANYTANPISELNLFYEAELNDPFSILNDLDTPAITTTDPALELNDPIIENSDSYRLHFNEEETPSSKKTTKKKKSKIKAKDSLSYAYKFFKDKGLTDALTLGFLGNLLGESNLDPTAYNKGEKADGLSGYGVGIAQWSDSRKQDFKRVMGIEPEKANLQQQLEFVWYEVQLRPVFYDLLKKSTTVEEAVELVLRGYENGSANALISEEQFNEIYLNNKHNGRSMLQAILYKLKRALEAQKQLQK